MNLWDRQSFTLRFQATDIPPSGRKTYQLVSGAAGGSAEGGGNGAEIRNPYFRLMVDPARGGIVSLTDRKTGRELISANDGNKDVAQYLHERFSSANVQEFMRAYCRMQGGWASNDFGKIGMPGPDKSPYARIALKNWQLIG